MNKTLIPVGIAAVVVAISIAYGTQMDTGFETDKKADGVVWQIRMSGIDDYEAFANGGIGYLEKGYYKVGFVPMGDSPSKIRIIIQERDTGIYQGQGIGRILDETYILDRDLVDTGISKYYTWEYNGDKSFFIPKGGSFFDIHMRYEGNVEGSVSVSITEVAKSI